MRTNQNDFFASATAGKTFKEVLTEVQEYLSEKYSNLLIDNEGDGKEQIKRYIRQYLIDNKVSVSEMSTEELIDNLYTEMAEFSFLTKYIYGTGVEEIDIISNL